jgi:hypothetical protein
MGKEKYQVLDDFQKSRALVGVCVLIFAVFAGAHNITTPDVPIRVGMTAIETNCWAIDAGVCLGVQKEDHTTYGYGNDTGFEEGTPNYYRRVESELMIQAYNICTDDMSGYEWTSEASYDGQTGKEWRQNEEIQLLPCEKTFYQNMTH